MEKVTGIGGVFFRAKDPAALKKWYHEHLGIGMEPGSWAQEAGPTEIAPFELGSDYFPPSQAWMMNFRVRDLDAMIAQLETANIEVVMNEEWNSVIGRFVRIHDPEGNPVELWEPSQMVIDHYGL